MALTHQFDVIVIGAGPAGTSAAITLARHGCSVALFEKGSFPRHKVCGEFVSPESFEIVRSLLGEEAPFSSAPRITSARIFIDGQVVAAPIQPAAASIPRFDMDAALWSSALRSGVIGHAQTTIRSIARSTDGFLVSADGAAFNSRFVIDATGRWSNLRAERQPLPPGPRWIGVKQHFVEDAPPCSTDLYFFEGGYCGVQPVAADCINVCAMVRADTAASLDQVLALHPALWLRSRTWEDVSGMAGVTTSPLVFRRTEPVCESVLQVGDAAGFIDPFVGDGISLALRSGVLAAQCILQRPSLADVCAMYDKLYRRRLGGPFRMASRLRALIGMPRMVRSLALKVIGSSAGGRYIVRSTR